MKYKLAFTHPPKGFGLGQTARRVTFTGDEPHYLWIVGVVADRLHPDLEGSACVVLLEDETGFNIKQYRMNAITFDHPENIVDAMRKHQTIFVRL